MEERGKKNESNVDHGQGDKKERVRERGEEEQQQWRDVLQIINQRQMLSRRIKRRTAQQRRDISVYASQAAKMTDTKSVASVEVPEGKLLKKVSGCCLSIPNPASGFLTSPTFTVLTQRPD